MVDNSPLLCILKEKREEENVFFFKCNSSIFMVLCWKSVCLACMLNSRCSSLVFGVITFVADEMLLIVSLTRKSSALCSVSFSFALLYFAIFFPCFFLVEYSHYPWCMCLYYQVECLSLCRKPHH